MEHKGIARPPSNLQKLIKTKIKEINRPRAYHVPDLKQLAPYLGATTVIIDGIEMY